MAKQERDKLVLETVEYDDGWRWRGKRGDRVVIYGKEAYARQDSALRAVTRIVKGLAAELGLIVIRPLYARKRPTRRRK